MRAPGHERECGATMREVLEAVEVTSSMWWWE